MAAKIKAYALENKDKIKEYQDEYRILNQQRIKAQRTTYSNDNHNRIMWSGSKSRAKRDNLEFNIDHDDVIIPEFCPILHTRLEVSKGSVSHNSPSLDRIDPSKGYIKGNVQVISYKANTMKSNADIQDLVLFAGWVLDKFIKEENDNTVL